MSEIERQKNPVALKREVTRDHTGDRTVGGWMVVMPSKCIPRLEKKYLRVKHIGENSVDWLQEVSQGIKKKINDVGRGAPGGSLAGTSSVGKSYPAGRRCRGLSAKGISGPEKKVAKRCRFGGGKKGGTQGSPAKKNEKVHNPRGGETRRDE